MAFQPGEFAQHLDAALRRVQGQFGQPFRGVPAVSADDHIVAIVAVEILANIKPIGVGPHGLTHVASGEAGLRNPRVVRHHAQLGFGQRQAGARLDRHIRHGLAECGHTSPGCSQ